MTNSAMTSGEASLLLAPCPACGKSISVDADACLGCGRGNDWVHPKIAQIVDYLQMHYPDAVYERRGHQIAVEMRTYNLRQQFGSACLALSMLFLIGGFIIPTLMGLAILLLAIGGCLIMFGASASDIHSIRIDLRQADPVVAVSDWAIWAGVVSLVR